MKFKIKDIGELGVRVQRELGPEEVVRLIGESDIVWPAQDAGAAVDLHLSRTQEEVVSVRGSISGQLRVPCSRCLEPALVEVAEERVHLTFLPPAAAAREQEELELEDLDTHCHDGQIIDLAPMIREHLLLAIPMMPLCDPECKGICSQCGADLNQAACGCETTQPAASPWSKALAELKKNLSGGSSSS